ncbi:hypothetical protein Droror1_Dr00007301 [Drosera rotundifolia]
MKSLWKLLNVIEHMAPYLLFSIGLMQVQRKLQLQIEEQDKYLLQMFEQQNKMEQEKLKASSSGPLASAADTDEQVASEIDQARAEPGERNSSASKEKQKVTEAVVDDGQQRVADGSFSMESPPRKCPRMGGAELAPSIKADKANNASEEKGKGKISECPKDERLDDVVGHHAYETIAPYPITSSVLAPPRPPLSSLLSPLSSVPSPPFAPSPTTAADADLAAGGN